MRASLVNRDTLARLARGLGLGAEISLGEGEVRSGGGERPSILADALEAVFGAVFVDAGFDAARAVIERVYAAEFVGLDPAALGKDPKTRLQEWLQARRIAVPEYAVTGDQRRGARADVHDRMPRAGAGHRRHRHRHEPPRGGAGRRRGRHSPGPLPRRAARTVADAPRRRRVSLRLRGDRRPAERRQVDAAQPSGRPEGQHHVAQGADDAPPRHRHRDDAGRPGRLRRHAGIPDEAPLAPQRPDEPGGDAMPRRRRCDGAGARGRPHHGRRSRGDRACCPRARASSSR